MSLSKRDIEHIGLILDKKLEARLMPVTTMVEADHQTLHGNPDSKTDTGLVGSFLRTNKRVYFLLWLAAVFTGILIAASFALAPVVSKVVGLTLPTLIRILY